jgi:2,5-diketo-D-gluconate reductase A
MTHNQPTISLNDGRVMPQIGFGVFLVPEDETYDAVAHALKTGYRSIDTAALYGNEVPTGRAITDSGVAREELFVTTKVWNDDQGFDATLRAFDASMGRLGLDYLDLYLIHWPTPERGRYGDTWRALQTLQSDGRVRSIGVSNFQVPHLQRILDEYDVVPAVNQIELHPELTQGSLRAFHAEHGIVTEAWSPLARGGLLDDPVIAEISGTLHRTPAQVILRWHLQLGNVVIPKSVTPARIEENFDVLGFELSGDQMSRISGLDKNRRIGPDPDTFN